jgi:hypothetical protein
MMFRICYWRHALCLLNLRFLNDSEEFIHTRKVAGKIIDEAPELDADGFENRELLAKAEIMAFDGGAVNSVEVFVRPPAGSETLVSFAPCVYDALPQEKLLLDALRHALEEIAAIVREYSRKPATLTQRSSRQTRRPSWTNS